MSKDTIRRLVLHIVCSNGRPMTYEEIENEVKQRCWSTYSRWSDPRLVLKGILRRLVAEGFLIDDGHGTYICVAPKRVRWDYPPRCG